MKRCHLNATFQISASIWPETLATTRHYGKRSGERRDLDQRENYRERGRIRRRLQCLFGSYCSDLAYESRYLMSIREFSVMAPPTSIPCKRLPQPAHSALELAWPLSTWSLASSSHSFSIIQKAVLTLPPFEAALQDSGMHEPSRKSLCTRGLTPR